MTASLGLAFALAACSGRSGALPIASVPQMPSQGTATQALAAPALGRASFDALPAVVSTASHPVTVKKIEWASIPKATAGTKFANPAKIQIVALEASGKRIIGVYANPIELHDADTTGATQLLIGGKPATAKNLLKTSSDAVTLAYDGLAIAPATLSASARGLSSKTPFAPKLNAIQYSGPKSAGAPSIALTSQATSASFSATEAGWTNAPYDRPLRVVPGCIVCLVCNRVLDVRHVV